MDEVHEDNNLKHYL